MLWTDLSQLADLHRERFKVHGSQSACGSHGGTIAAYEVTKRKLITTSAAAKMPSACGEKRLQPCPWVR